MATLRKIPFKSTIDNRDDRDRNAKLEAGIVLVETRQTQAVLGKLPSADVEQLAVALNALLDTLNADRPRTGKIWSWHLALTDSPGGQGGQPVTGGAGKTLEGAPR